MAPAHLPMLSSVRGGRRTPRSPFFDHPGGFGYDFGEVELRDYEDIQEKLAELVGKMNLKLRQLAFNNLQPYSPPYYDFPPPPYSSSQNLPYSYSDNIFVNFIIMSERSNSTIRPMATPQTLNNRTPLNVLASALLVNISRQLQTWRHKQNCLEDTVTIKNDRDTVKKKWLNMARELAETFRKNGVGNEEECHRAMSRYDAHEKYMVDSRAETIDEVNARIRKINEMVGMYMRQKEYLLKILEFCNTVRLKDNENNEGSSESADVASVVGPFRWTDDEGNPITTVGEDPIVEALALVLKYRLSLLRNSQEARVTAEDYEI